MEQTKNKKIILLLVLMLMSKFIFTQPLEHASLRNMSLFNNKEIKYCVGNFTNSFFIPIEDLGLNIDYIKQLNDTILYSQLKQVKKEDWLKLLENEKSDWATSIVLHYMFNESAVYYCQKESNDLGFWRFSFKKEEIETLTKLLDEKPFREKMCCEYTYTRVYCSWWDKVNKEKAKKKRRKVK